MTVFVISHLHFLYSLTLLTQIEDLLAWQNVLNSSYLILNYLFVCCVFVSCAHNHTRGDKTMKIIKAILLLPIHYRSESDPLCVKNFLHKICVSVDCFKYVCIVCVSVCFLVGKRHQIQVFYVYYILCVYTPYSTHTPKWLEYYYYLKWNFPWHKIGFPSNIFEYFVFFAYFPLVLTILYYKNTCLLYKISYLLCRRVNGHCCCCLLLFH